jgi:AraC-like DNA-binding protein
MTGADKALTRSFAPVRQTVATGMALGLIGYAGSNGADPEALRTIVGLTNAADQDPNRRIPIDRYIAMFREAARQCSDPALAIHFAEATHFADLSIVGLIGYAAETMRDALDQLNRFGRLVTDIAVNGRDRFTLVDERDGLWLIDNRIDEPHFPELTEQTFVRMVAGTRQFGTLPYASLAEVTHHDRGIGSELERVLAVPVRFGAPRNALRVSLEWQTYRVALFPRYAFSLFCEHADCLLAKLEAEQSISGQVERAILPILHTGTVSAERIASQLGLSGQGLYRMLRAEGMTFAEILAGLRHRFAKGYLDQQRASLKEIAFLLGYSEVSAFSRAFKRREGQSPGAYQASLRTGD